MRIDGLRFGLAGGLTLGLGLALATLISYYTGHAPEALMLFTFYPGYEVSVLGAGTGFLWGFLDGFFGAVFFAWLYNHIHRYHD